MRFVVRCSSPNYGLGHRHYCRNRPQDHGVTRAHDGHAPSECTSQIGAKPRTDPSVSDSAEYFGNDGRLLLHLEAIVLELLAKGFEIAAARGVLVALPTWQPGLSSKFRLRERWGRRNRGHRADEKCGTDADCNAINRTPSQTCHRRPLYFIRPAKVYCAHSAAQAQDCN